MALKKISNYLVFLLFSLSIALFVSVDTINIFRKAIVLVFFVILLIVSLVLQKVSVDKVTISGLIFIFYDFLTLLFNNAGIVSIFTQIYIFLLIMTLRNIELSQKQIRYLLLLVIIIWGVWIVNSKNYYLKFSFNSDLLNSNTVALILLFTYEFAIGFIQQRKLINKKLIKLILTLFTILGIWNCDSRTILVALIFFILCNDVISIKFWTPPKIVISSSLIFFGGTIFPGIYLSLQNNIYIQEMIFNLTSKSLYTGRQVIWQSVFNNGFGRSIKNWLFGLGALSTEGLNTIWGSDLHNSYLIILYNFGILGLILFYIFIIQNIVSLTRHFDLPLVRTCFFAFCSMLFTGYAETTMTWFITAPLVFSFLAFGNNKYMICNYEDSI